MKTAKEIHQELLNDPEVKRLYDDLEVEFVLAESLVDLRHKKKMSQKQLAQRLKTTQSAVARLESGKANPRLSSLVKIAKSLGMELKVQFV